MAKPKVISYTILHYGADYLPYAIQSIYSQVDVINIFYTPNPTHGHTSHLQCPETKEQLQQAAFSYNPDGKVRWYDYDGPNHEGHQRDAAVKFCQDEGADIILVVDSDEVWDGLTLNLSIARVWELNLARNHLINFTHLWRSFDWCCKDEGWPVRLIDLRHSEGVEYIPREYGEMFHFGYAITDEIMEYKLSIHGHKAELRDNWFSEKWQNWTPDIKDVHPTNERDFWTPEPFNVSKLPKFMQSHPYWGVERVE